MKKSHFWAIVTSLFVYLIGLVAIICCMRENCPLYLASYMIAWSVGLLALGAVHFVKVRLQ